MRIAPDPLAAVLPALSALGAIASIAAINWVAQERQGRAARTRRNVSAALRDLEGDCQRLEALFSRMDRLFRAHVGERGAASSPIKFGVHGLRIAQQSWPLYQSLLSDMAESLVCASQNSFDVMCLIEDGAIDPPEDIYYGFGEQQERLNQLLIERASLRASVEAGVEIAGKLARLVRELRRHKTH